MKSFGKMLRGFIENSGYTIYGIAQKANINRTTLQKLLSDERKPTADQVRKLRPFLKLTPAETIEFDMSFELIQVGEELFEQRTLIKQLLENISYVQPENGRPPRYPDDDGLDLLPSPGLHEGYLSVYRLLRELILWECVLPKSASPCVRINAPANMEIFRDLFIHTMRECHESQLSIMQLTSFLKPGAAKNAFSFNLEILANILPFLPLSDFQYQVYYYYTDAPVTDIRQFSFPYYVLFSNTAVLLSTDCHAAIVSRDPALLHYLGNLFSAAMKEAGPFTLSYHRAEDVLPHLMEMDLEDLPFYSLEYQPCLMSYVTERMIQNYSRIQEPEDAISILQLTSMRARQLRGLNHHISIFSKNGIHHFARTGQIADLPSCYAKPFSERDRIYILECLYRDILSDLRHHRVINPLVLPISEHLLCLLHQNSGLDFSYFTNDGKNYGYLRIEEPSLLEAFEDFFQYMLRSAMVGTKEETLAVIQECIDEIKHP